MGIMISAGKENREWKEQFLSSFSFFHCYSITVVPIFTPLPSSTQPTSTPIIIPHTMSMSMGHACIYFVFFKAREVSFCRTCHLWEVVIHFFQIQILFDFSCVYSSLKLPPFSKGKLTFGFLASVPGTVLILLNTHVDKFCSFFSGKEFDFSNILI